MKGDLMTEFQPPAMTGLARFTSGSITARDGQITSADPHDGTPSRAPGQRL